MSLLGVGLSLNLVAALTFGTGGQLGGQLSGQDPSQDFERARARELSSLQAERDELERGLREARSSGEAARRKLEGQVESLARQLATVEGEAAAMVSTATERSEFHAEETEAEHFADLTADVDAWLRARAFEVPEGEGPAAFPTKLAAVLEAVEADAGTRIERDVEVFDAAGLPVRRDLIMVGEVAAVDLEGTATYARSPDGLHEVPGVLAERRALEADVTALQAWVQDPDRPFDTSQANHTWRDTLRQGGPLMWVLAAFGVIGAMVLLERCVVLVHAAWRRRRLRIALGEAAGSAQLWQAGGRLAKPIVAARGEAATSVSAGGPVVEDLEAREAKAVAAIRELQDHLNRRLSVLAVLSGAAPLVGLLGTVSGMITTFTVVTEQGSSDPQAMAGGISEALLTTQYGLAVAIPLLLAHVMATRGARRIVASVESAAVAALFAGDATRPPTSERASARDSEGDTGAP